MRKRRGEYHNVKFVQLESTIETLTSNEVLANVEEKPSCE